MKSGTEATVADTITLTRSEQQRLTRLAREAECRTRDVLRAVLRDGFEYTEYKIRSVNEGLADLSAGRTMSLDELKARVARRRAERGRVRRKAA